MMKIVSALSQAGIVDLHYEEDDDDVALKVSSVINRSCMTQRQVEVEAGMKARDRVLRDVMTETSEENRGRLLTIAMDNMPHAKYSFIDWVIVVSILSQVGIVDLHDEEEDYNDLLDRDDWGYRIDLDGRVTRFDIRTSANDPFDLPAIVGRLKILTILILWHCRSLPAKKLSILSQLETVYLGWCSDLPNNFPIWLPIPILVTVPHMDDRATIPSLEILQFGGFEKNETNCILDALQNIDTSFHESLKHFKMTSYELNDSHLETLVLEILPKLRIISSLNLRRNGIQSVQPVVDRIKNNANYSMLFRNRSVAWILHKTKIPYCQIRKRIPRKRQPF